MFYTNPNLNTSLTLFFQFLSFLFAKRRIHTKTHNIGKSFQFITSHNIVQLLRDDKNLVDSINNIMYGLKDYIQRTPLQYLIIIMFPFAYIPTFCVSTLCFNMRIITNMEERILKKNILLGQVMNILCVGKDIFGIHAYITRMFK